jgi:hypothetical protein
MADQLPSSKPDESAVSRRNARAASLFQRIAADDTLSQADIEKQTLEALFSEVEWAQDQLHELRDGDWESGWRVERLRELVGYCRRCPDPTWHVIAFAEFLAPRFSPEVQSAAGECIRLLLPPAGGRTLQIPATISAMEDEVAVVRFEHPSLGVVEREFEAKALPPGAEAEDRFELAVELDVRGRVIAYQPMRDRLEKAAVPEWEKVPIPPPPENLDDREALARYDEAMTRYMARVTELQAPEVERWRAASRSK